MPFLLILIMNLIKSKEEIQIMTEGGKILATVLAKIAKMAVPGITTLELDRAAEKLILECRAVPAFKGYQGLPFSLCASVNDVVLHGLPANYTLQNGDIVGLDLGVLWKGYNTDSAVTVAVGEVSFEAKRLLDVTKKSLRMGIKKARPGATIGYVGTALARKFMKIRKCPIMANATKAWN